MSNVTSPAQSQSEASQPRRISPRLIATIGIMLAVLLVAGVTFAAQKLAYSRAAAAGPAVTINRLTKIAAVGATNVIVGANGKTETVDPNPYGIIVSPFNTPNGLKQGDILASDIGNNETGNTIVKFTGQKGPGHVFNVTPSKGTVGPADLAFNAQTKSLWVSNATANDVQIFRPNGTLETTITDPLINHPWGMATNGGNVQVKGVSTAFFVSNVKDATIDRIDVVPQANGLPLFKVAQIGKLTLNGAETKIGLKWIPQLTVGKKTWKDVLLAIDPANNRIAAYANSSTVDANGVKGVGAGVTVFAGKPLDMPGGFAINPLNGDLLVVNLMNNDLVELNLAQGKAVGVKQIDPAAVDAQGNGSALFGIAAIKDDKGNLRVFFTDDNTNTVDVLSAS
jgi:hypothetical protein